MPARSVVLERHLVGGEARLLVERVGVVGARGVGGELILHHLLALVHGGSLIRRVVDPRVVACRRCAATK